MGAEDKRQVTVCTAVAADGTMLPPQIVCEGKSSRVTPAKAIVDLPQYKGFHWTFSPNHWANETTMQQWMAEILHPYMQKAMLETKSTKGVLLLDCWGVHIKQSFRDHVREHYPYLQILYVPAGTTPIAQVCDVSVQR